MPEAEFRIQIPRCQDRHVGAVVGENKGNYKLPKAAKSRIQLGPRRSHIPRTSSQGSLWTLHRVLCAAEGQEEETKRASRDPMHRCEVRRIQGDIIQGARQKPKRSRSHRASIQKRRSQKANFKEQKTNFKEQKTKGSHNSRTDSRAVVAEPSRA